MWLRQIEGIKPVIDRPWATYGNDSMAGTVGGDGRRGDSDGLNYEEVREKSLAANHFRMSFIEETKPGRH